MITLKELAAETLSQKHRRLTQAKCAHEEVWVSTVYGPDGIDETRACLDCGKTWNSHKKSLHE